MAAAKNNEDIQFIEVIKIIWRRRYLALSAFILALLLGFIVLLVNPSNLRISQEFFLNPIMKEANTILFVRNRIFSKMDYVKLSNVFDRQMKSFRLKQENLDFKGYSYELRQNVTHEDKTAPDEKIPVYSILLMVDGADETGIYKYFAILKEKVLEMFLQDLFEGIYNNYENILQKKKVILENKVYDTDIKIHENRELLKILKSFKASAGKGQTVLLHADIKPEYLPLEQQIIGKEVIIVELEISLGRIKREIVEVGKALEILKKRVLKGNRDLGNSIREIQDISLRNDFLQLLQARKDIRNKLMDRDQEYYQKRGGAFLLLIFIFLAAIVFVLTLIFILEWWKNNKDRLRTGHN